MVLGAARHTHHAIGGHDAQPQNRARHRGMVLLPTVSISAQGAANAERVVGLHDAQRTPVAIEEGNDLGPQRSGAHAQRAVPRERHSLERRHVDHDAVRRDGVAPHRVARAGDRDLQLLLLGAS